jgi:iron complex transport system ATP-binding protein
VKLQIENLKFAYNPATPVLKDISMDASPGEITALIGPNAAGKSTLLKCVAGVVKPQGTIKLDGQEITSLNRDDVSKSVSYLPQELSSRAILTVFEAVLLGRLKTLSWRVGDNDLDIVLGVLKDLGIEELASRFLNELSGGQKQMVSIAQTFASEPKILLLDEPVSNLDLRHELEILELITNTTREKNITTVIAIHALSLAARYADKVVVLKGGAVYASGQLETVLTPETVREVYGVNVKVVSDGGIPQVIPISSARNNKHNR